MLILIYVYYYINSNKMSTLNYIGSKKTLLDFINSVIDKINKNFDDKTTVKFLDGFAGSGIVGKYFNNKYGYITSSNDMEYYSYVISYALLKVPYSEKLKMELGNINKLVKTDNADYNLITENYSEKGKDKRKFWIISNAQKADAIIEYINKNYNNRTLTNDEKMFLLASLISSIDKLANTASVYGAFLKKYKKSAEKTLEVKAIHNNLEITNVNNNISHNLDINELAKNDYIYDIVYLDPPYNNRQYSSNYHPLNFIAKYDKTIIPYGKTGLHNNLNKSKFSISKSVIDTFAELINNLRAKYILLSYNNEGLMSSDTIKKVLEIKGKTTLYKYLYKKFKSQKIQIDAQVYEYLYLCEVGTIGEFTTVIVNQI